jgi:hypothetical protein
MSGQPYRYSKDVENFRNEYMDALNLRANIDDMNFQANKIYSETGALPPRSTMKDMRTTAEILMDVEKLKINIISEFKGVATPQMIQLVLQRVQASPLNGDGSFLVWLAQNVKELVPQLKKKYAYGIVGDANDAEQMYLFLQTTYAKTKDMSTTVKSAFDRPIGNSPGIEAGDLDTLRSKYKEIQLKLQSLQTSSNSPGAVSVARLTQEIKLKFESLNSVISSQGYTNLKTIFLNTSSGANSMQQIAVNNQGYHEWIKYTEDLPSVIVLNTLLEQIKKSTENSNNELTIKLLNNLSSLLPTVNTNTAMNNTISSLVANNISQLHGQIVMPGPLGPINNPVFGPAPAPAPGPPQAPQTAAQRIMDYFLLDLVNIIQTTAADVNIQNDVQFKDNVLLRLTQLENHMTSTVPLWKNEIKYSQFVTKTGIADSTSNYSLQFVAQNPVTRGILGASIRNAVVASGAAPGAGIMTGAGIGNRVGRPRGSGIVKPLSERIDKTKGIKQGHTHVPFGKYIINKNRLDDDIFSFKHVKGYGVKGYPSKKISRNLSNVIKTIIGGGVPKFNELSNLSEDEKEYLHTVSSKAGIMDKLSVPTPSKDSMEQDVHQFNVMKGEILAGNDSSQLIKKFKLLLLKLSKNGSLPKRECQEIMEDLIQLGY